MTDAEIEKIARLMGARVVGKLPDVAHGATGATHLGQFFQRRLEALQRQEQGGAAAGPGTPASGSELAPTREELAAAVAEAEQAVGKLMAAVARARQLLGLLDGAGSEVGPLT
jgi:hypothetical protein